VINAFKDINCRPGIKIVNLDLQWLALLDHSSSAASGS